MNLGILWDKNIDLRYHVKKKHFKENKASCRYCKFTTFPKFNLDLHVLKVHDRIKQIVEK